MTINDNKAIPENNKLYIINFKEIFLILCRSRINEVRLQNLYPALCKHIDPNMAIIHYNTFF